MPRRLDECFSPKEASAQAFLKVAGDARLPEGEQPSQYFDEGQRRHFARVPAVRARTAGA